MCIWPCGRGCWRSFPFKEWACLRSPLWFAASWQRLFCAASEHRRLSSADTCWSQPTRTRSSVGLSVMCTSNSFWLCFEGGVVGLHPWDYNSSGIKHCSIVWSNCSTWWIVAPLHEIKSQPTNCSSAPSSQKAANLNNKQNVYVVWVSFWWISQLSNQTPGIRQIVFVYFLERKKE